MSFKRRVISRRGYQLQENQDDGEDEIIDVPQGGEILTVTKKHDADHLLDGVVDDEGKVVDDNERLSVPEVSPLEFNGHQEQVQQGHQVGVPAEVAVANHKLDPAQDTVAEVERCRLLPSPSPVATASSRHEVENLAELLPPDAVGLRLHGFQPLVHVWDDSLVNLCRLQQHPHQISPHEIEISSSGDSGLPD